MAVPALGFFYPFDAKDNRVLGIGATGYPHILLRFPGEGAAIFQGEKDRMNLMIGPGTEVGDRAGWILVGMHDHISYSKAEMASSLSLNLLDRNFKNFLIGSGKALVIKVILPLKAEGFSPGYKACLLNLADENGVIP